MLWSYVILMEHTCGKKCVVILLILLNVKVLADGVLLEINTM